MLIGILLLFFSVLLLPDPAYAYIGPGAGFAFLGSALVFILTFLMAIATIAFWPLQWCWRMAKGKRISKNARTRRVVIVGLDGLEPKLVDKYMKQGKLPNLEALKAEGSYKRLGTTLPALSPVAWSTFQTGVNPGAHNVFDFLTRDKRHCLPQLSSTETEPASRIISCLGIKFALEKAKIRLLRKSQPFWKILGKHGVFSTILRIPISYPPEKFHGNVLSAMCTPDLRGTQGTFCVFTTAKKAEETKATSGEFIEVTRERNVVTGAIEGPVNPRSSSGEALKAPFKVELRTEKQEAVLFIGKEKEVLKLNRFSRWIPIEFRFGLTKKLSGLCRFCLRELDPEFSMYVSPINVNPEKPALPIAHPVFFASYLAKKQGPFGTLGFLEDTWGRNELALDDEAFLEQAYLTHEEREQMFLESLDRTREGVCACVFDASDRIQHMFWRYIDENHPAPREEDESRSQVIEEMYQNMDEVVAKVRKKLDPDDVLIVMSDHGFTSFRRCINLNTWLLREGFLSLKEGHDPDADYFQNVDWSQTKAFAIGLSGIYINRKNRERWGIVEEGEAETVKREIIEKLEKLVDPEDHQPTIRRVYDTAKEYDGLYRDEAPDLLVGFERGYRTSWESVVGSIRSDMFENNLKAWSGDHGVDPVLVPGVLFCNRSIEEKAPHIRDIAPTVLDLFSVPVPAYMEGKVLF